MKNKVFTVVFIIIATQLLFVAKILANVILPSVISNNMVLQQNTTVTLWGKADAKEPISISCSWDTQIIKTIAGAKGSWLIHLKTIKAGGPYTISIHGYNTIVLNNILLGEVWLCSGQSNMNFPLGKQSSWRTGVLNFQEEIAKANYPNIRMFTAEQTAALEPRDNVNGDWEVCNPQNVGKFSAVAYYFARELTLRLGVPVGLIHVSWGGTAIESWTKKEVLESDSDFLPILQRYYKSIKDYPAAIKTYETELAQWKIDSGFVNVKGEKTHAPVKPRAADDSKSPFVLYNAMIHPLLPYTLKGIIWYQGESNSDRAYQYRKLFPALINEWRKDWNIYFPFYFVQIAPQYMQSPEIREAQLLTFLSVPKTGMAIVNETGDSLNIHPRNKEIVGKRLSLWALANEYGKKEVEYSGPIYKAMKNEGNKIRILFNYAKDGLIVKDKLVKEFTIAGEDKIFVVANAAIEGNTIVVWNDSIKKPVAVRFAWKNFPHQNLYNKANLPASPFRTDNWPGETFGRN